MVVTRIRRGERVGENVMRDMSSIYWKKTTKELRTLRSKKYNRRERLRSSAQGYLGQQEIRLLTHQIDTIDRIIDARNAQLWLIP